MSTYKNALIVGSLSLLMGACVESQVQAPSLSENTQDSSSANKTKSNKVQVLKVGSESFVYEAIDSENSLDSVQNNLPAPVTGAIYLGNRRDVVDYSSDGKWVLLKRDVKIGESVAAAQKNVIYSGLPSDGILRNVLILKNNQTGEENALNLFFEDQDSQYFNGQLYAQKQWRKPASTPSEHNAKILSNGLILLDHIDYPVPVAEQKFKQSIELSFLLISPTSPNKPIARLKRDIPTGLHGFFFLQEHNNTIVLKRTPYGKDTEYKFLSVNNLKEQTTPSSWSPLLAEEGYKLMEQMRTNPTYSWNPPSTKEQMTNLSGIENPFLFYQGATTDVLGYRAFSIWGTQNKDKAYIDAGGTAEEKQRRLDEVMIHKLYIVDLKNNNEIIHHKNTNKRSDLMVLPSNQQELNYFSNVFFAKASAANHKDSLDLYRRNGQGRLQVTQRIDFNSSNFKGLNFHIRAKKLSAIEIQTLKVGDSVSSLDKPLWLVPLK